MTINLLSMLVASGTGSLHFSTALFAANNNDIVRIIFGAIVFVLWLVGQIAGQRKQVQQQKNRQKQQAPRPKPKAPRPRPQQVAQARPATQGRPPQRGGRPQVPQAGDPLAKDIEDFLRRAGKKKKKPAHTMPSNKPKRSQPLAQQRERGQSPHRSTIDKGVAAHVSEHIGPKTFEKHTKNLAYNIRQSDERLEKHLDEEFEHSIGNMQHMAETVHNTTGAASPMAQAIVAMFKNPESVRQAIILKEVLDRPSERW